MTTNEESVSLKEYFDRVLSERDKALQAALASAKEAVSIAESASERWRANTNEWRATFSDRDQLFLTKAEFFSYRESTQRTLKEFSDFKEARAGVIADIESLNKDAKSLNTFRDSMEGKASQKSVSTAMVISFISLGIGVIGIVMGFIGK